MSFCGFLKQSTAITVPVGPFIDDADGKTPETGLTVTSIDANLYKGAGATKTDLTLSASGGDNDMAHVEDGYYSLELTATDTGTLGNLRLTCHISGALIVDQSWCVLPANVYDALIGGSDYLQTDAVQVEGSDATNQIRDAVVDDATRIDASALNTLSSHDPGSALPSAAALATVDGVVDAILEDTGTTLPATLSAIAGYIDTEVAAIKAVTDLLPDAGALTSLATAADLATVDTVVDAIKAKTDNLPAAPAATGDVPSAASVADAVWDEAIAGHVSAGTFGAKNQHLVPSETIGDYKADVSALATAAALSTVDGVVDAILEDTGTTLPATLSAIAGYIDTEVAAIKAVTDLLPDAGALSALANLDAAVSSRSSHDAAAVKTAIEAAGGHLALIKVVTDALTAAAAARLAASAAAIVPGLAAAGTLSTTAMTTDLTEATDNHYVGRVVIWTSGALAAQAATITGYDGTEKKLTFAAVTEAPTAGDGFVIL